MLRSLSPLITRRTVATRRHPPSVYPSASFSLPVSLVDGNPGIESTSGLPHPSLLHWALTISFVSLGTNPIVRITPFLIYEVAAYGSGRLRQTSLTSPPKVLRRDGGSLCRVVCGALLLLRPSWRVLYSPQQVWLLSPMSDNSGCAAMRLEHPVSPPPPLRSSAAAQSSTTMCTAGHKRPRRNHNKEIDDINDKLDVLMERDADLQQKIAALRAEASVARSLIFSF